MFSFLNYYIKRINVLTSMRIEFTDKSRFNRINFNVHLTVTHRNAKHLGIYTFTTHSLAVINNNYKHHQFWKSVESSLKIVLTRIFTHKQSILDWILPTCTYLLLPVLCCLNISPSVIDWILLRPSAAIVHPGYNSRHGVPQGSALSPLFYPIFKFNKSPHLFFITSYEFSAIVEICFSSRLTSKCFIILCI